MPDCQTSAPISPPVKLLDQVRDRIRRLGYAKRTEVSYVHWIKRYIVFHGKRHPKEMGKPEVEAFLTALAVQRNVAASTQNLALSAILFLYREVLTDPLPWLNDVVRAKKPALLPTVLSRTEVQSVLAKTDGLTGLVLRLLYGNGMRLMECVRLRVKDVDFSLNQINVRDGKGGKDRVTMLPQTLINPLRLQLAQTKALHDADLAVGMGSVWLPDALAVKYPNASKAWGWQTRPFRCFDDDDLHPCVEQGRARGSESAGSVAPLGRHLPPHDSNCCAFGGRRDKAAFPPYLG